MKTIYLVDGSGYIFRAYYAVHHLSNSAGLPTNALFGFTRMLGKLLREMEADHIAVMFDTGKPTFRHEMYEEYKANRSECPEDLVPQMPYFRDVVKALGIASLEKEGFEADDIIATVARRLAGNGTKVVIVSGDKDLAQLVNSEIKVWDAMRDVHFTPDAVTEKFGVPPEQIIDYLALVGDSSDNVPGLKGVGPKSAQKLLQEAGSLEELLNNPARVADIKGLRGGKKIQEQLELSPDSVRLSQKLVTLDDLVEPFNQISDVDEFLWSGPDMDTAQALFNELEFADILSSIPCGNAQSNGSSEKETLNKQYITVTSKTLSKIVAELAKQDCFAFDTETTSLDVLECQLAGISIAWEENTAYYFPVLCLEEDGPALDADELRDLLGPIFADESIEKVGLNLKYDLGVLEEHGYEVKGLAFDAMLASHVMRPDSRQHSLSALTSQHLHEQMLPYKELVGDAEDIAHVKLEEVAKYACHDADASYRLFLKLNEILGDREVDKISGAEGASQRRVFEEIEMPLIPVLSKIERAGIEVDIPFLEGLSAEFGSELAELEKEIYSQAGKEFNINSPKQLSEVLFVDLEISTKGIKKTASGHSTNASVLEKLSDDYEIAEKLIEYRELHKLKSTYVEALRRLVSTRTNRIHTSFNQAVAATGRLSSSDPNLQNIPIRTERGRRIRNAFRAQEGFRLISADYSQIELRVVAHLAADENMSKAFQEGRDIHEATAVDLFGSLAMEGDDKSMYRRYAKTINFGIIYGMSAFRLARELGISRKEAQRFIDDYFAKFSGVASYFESLEEMLERDGYVSTMFGRRRFAHEIDAAGRDQGYIARSLLNAPIQGSAAEIIKIAMVRLDERLEEFGEKARMVLQVHDELVVEAEASVVDSVAAVVKEVMEDAVELSVPLDVDVKIGESWGQME